MTKVRVYEHPFAEPSPVRLEVENFAEWLLQRYVGRVRPQIYAGEPSPETNISTDADAILRGDAAEYVVLEKPGIPGAPLLVNLALSMVASAVVNDLFGPSSRPQQNLNRDQESPNNQLSDRTNQVRTLQRVEDIFGTVRSIPTLMMPTYTKYIANSKVEYGYYCVGRGYYDISDVRDGDTALSNISGTSAAVYAPFTSPNSGTPQLQIGDPIIDAIVTVVRSSAVDGIVLKPLNQLQLAAPNSYLFSEPGVGGTLWNGETLPTTTLDFIWQPTGTRRPNFAAVAQIGQTVTISMSDAATTRGGAGIPGTIDVDGATNKFTSSNPGLFRSVVDGSSVTVSGTFANPSNAGTFTVVSHTDDTLTVSSSLTTETGATEIAFDLQVNFSGTRTIADVQPNYVTLTGASQYFGDQTNATITVNNGLSDWSDWMTLPSTDRTEVWTNVHAPSGMYKDDGAKSAATVAYEIQIEQLDALLAPTGVVETVSGTITGATSNERAETLERVTAWTGPARVRARRTTAFDYDFQGLVVDEIQWLDLYSVSPVSKSHFGNKTTIHTVTHANQDATALRSRELNCLASRKLPTYNGTSLSGSFDASGQLVSGTIAATSRMVDILLAITIDPRIGASTLATLDVAQVWATQQALDAWNAECGQFNYTFDSDNISFEETVTAIAQAAFCVAYRQNGVIRLALDRPQAASSALFTHRNKKPGAESITRSFASDSEYDGVELVYVDPESEKQETIRLPLDGSYTKLKKVERTGIRSYEQAWFHANREYYRLRNQRLALDMDTTTDARALLPNMRIDNVDETRFKAYAGEVIAQDGLKVTLSREVAFLPSTPHSIHLQKRDGSLQSIACTEVVGAANQVLLATTPAEALITTPTPADGIRTVFSFAADSARAAQAWLVQEVGSSDGKYVRVTAINYSDAYYTADSAAIPAKSGVIN